MSSILQHTILIVDDHATMRRALGAWLGAAFPRCRVLEAADGAQALGMAQDSLPSVMVMDIGLPDMSGIEVTRRIKQAQPGVWVVMLSVYEEEAYRADAARAGASAYVCKRNLRNELVPILSGWLA